MGRTRRPRGALPGLVAIRWWVIVKALTPSTTGFHRLIITIDEGVATVEGVSKHYGD